jgi:hypothetical protein
MNVQCPIILTPNIVWAPYCIFWQFKASKT